MNYKVTFYKNETEMLTERKANFVNQLKKLSSELTSKIAQKCYKNGTQANRIKEKLGKNYSFSFDFQNFTVNIIFSHSKDYTFRVSGNSKILDFGGHYIPKEMTIKIESNGKNISQEEVIKKLHQTISHELIHMFYFESTTKIKPKYDNAFMKQVLYFIQPNELKAHCMELVTLIATKNLTHDDAWDEIITNYFGKCPAWFSNLLLKLHVAFTKSNSKLHNRFYKRYFSNFKIENEESYSTILTKIIEFINKLEKNA